MNETNNAQVPWEHSALTGLLFFGEHNGPSGEPEQYSSSKLEPTVTCSELEERVTGVFSDESLSKSQFQASLSELGKMRNMVSGQCETKKQLFFGPIIKI